MSFDKGNFYEAPMSCPHIVMKVSRLEMLVIKREIDPRQVFHDKAGTSPKNFRTSPNNIINFKRQLYKLDKIV